MWLDIALAVLEALGGPAGASALTAAVIAAVLAVVLKRIRSGS
jgi:hypothetical protein